MSGWVGVGAGMGAGAGAGVGIVQQLGKFLGHLGGTHSSFHFILSLFLFFSVFFPSDL